jgi:hypothetical protein
MTDGGKRRRSDGRYFALVEANGDQWRTAAKVFIYVAPDRRATIYEVASLLAAVRVRSGPTYALSITTAPKCSFTNGARVDKGSVTLTLLKERCPAAGDQIPVTRRRTRPEKASSAAPVGHGGKREAREVV